MVLSERVNVPQRVCHRVIHARTDRRLRRGQAAAATLERINYIDPVFDPDTHRQLGRLWLGQKRYPGAIREYAAVVATHPHDMAAAELDLAQAYFAAGERDKAQDAVLESLAAAPNYKPAQALLLKITDAKQP